MVVLSPFKRQGQVSLHRAYLEPRVEGAAAAAAAHHRPHGVEERAALLLLVVVVRPPLEHHEVGGRRLTFETDGLKGMYFQGVETKRF